MKLIVSLMSKLFLLSIFALLFESCAPLIERKPSPLPVSESDEVFPATKDDSADKVDPDALRYFMDGQMYMSQANYARAIIDFQDALAIDPAVSTIHVSLAECFWHLGKTKRSQHHLKMAINVDPNDTEAREMLAHQYIMQQKFEKAEAQFRTLTEIDSENSEYVLALADLAKIQHRFDQALNLYLKTYDLNPKAIRALEKAAEVALNEKQMNVAQDIYKKLVETDEMNLQYLQMYSDLALVNGDMVKGIQALNQIKEISGATPEILNRLGVVYYESDQPDSALKFFTESLVRDSINSTALHHLSQLYRELEDYENARLHANELIRFHPDEPQGYINSALLALSQEKNGDAITILSDPAEQFQDNYVIQFLLGTAYHLEQNTILAEVYLKKAVTISPGARNAWHTLAIIYDTSKRWAESDKVYEQLIQDDSTDAQAYNNYAYSLVERSEKLDVALDMAETAIRISPDNSAYLDTIGWIYFRIGDNDKALFYIRRSVEIESTNAIVLEHLGDVLKNSNLHEEAQNYYLKALDLNHDNERLKAKVTKY